VNEPLPLQPEMLSVQLAFPLACVNDWNVPEIELLVNEAPLIGSAMIGWKGVTPLGQEGPPSTLML
jgi:hypothetical protein